MLCIKCNFAVEWFKGWLFCPECEYSENTTLPLFFYFHEFVALAYGEDFHGV